MLRLLCITAHPDDEAGAFGGILLLYGERGVETSVICLTAGTAAKNRGTARTDEELATFASPNSGVLPLTGSAAPRQCLATQTANLITRASMNVLGSWWRDSPSYVLMSC